MRHRLVFIANRARFAMSIAVWLTLSFLPLAISQVMVEPANQDHSIHAGHDTDSVPESNRDHSLFMHHVSGVVVLMLGIVVFADRATGERSRPITIGIGGIWLLLGLFLFIYADPEAWPIGSLGFLDSFSIPTRGEWLQHKALSLLVIVLGIVWFRSMTGSWTIISNYALGAVSVIGAVGLLAHRHAAHPGKDLVNTQHRLFALTALCIAVALVLEGWPAVGWKHKRLVFPVGLLVLGLQLLFFQE